MPDENSARNLGKRRQQQQRDQHLSKATAPDRRPLSGECVGYDADAAAYLIKIGGGGIIRASSLSNGAIARGDRVRVNTARGSSQATVDGMPR